MPKRFIIHIDEENNDFEIETPDGSIPLEDLLFILDSTIHTLVEANNKDLEEHYTESDSILEDEEEETPTEKYVSGTREPNKKDLN